MSEYCEHFAKFRYSFNLLGFSSQTLDTQSQVKQQQQQ